MKLIVETVRSGDGEVKRHVVETKQAAERALKLFMKGKSLARVLMEVAIVDKHGEIEWLVDFDKLR